MFNKVMLMGRLGQDPVLNYTKHQTAYCAFTLATNERRKNGDQWEDVTEWHNIRCWGKTAENCDKYLAKGSIAFVEGSIRTESYEKEGIKRYITKIHANSVKFIPSGDKQKSKNAGGFTDSLSDIPF